MLLLPGVWAGVSVADQQQADECIPHLLQTPAAVRFLWCEPLLSGLDLSRWLKGISWVIVGGESGPGARPCRIEWVRSLVSQCEAAGVACFIKQLGSQVRWSPASGPCGMWPDHVRFDYERRGEESAHRIRLRDRKGGDITEWPEELRVREFPREGVVT